MDAEDTMGLQDTLEDVLEDAVRHAREWSEMGIEWASDIAGNAPSADHIIVLPFVLGIVAGSVLFFTIAFIVFWRYTATPLLSKKYPQLVKPLQRKVRAFLSRSLLLTLVQLSSSRLNEILAQDKGARTESSEWLNSVLSRLFYENAKEDWFSEFVSLKVRAELIDLKRDGIGCFFKEMKVSEVYPGSTAPRISNIAVLGTHSTSSDMTVLFDVDYTGGFALVLDFETWFGLCLSLRVRIRELKGRLAIIYFTNPIKLIHFGFVTPPTLNADITTLVLNRHIPYAHRAEIDLGDLEK